MVDGEWVEWREERILGEHNFEFVDIENIPKDLGTRHRAGIGITETIDVTALIVSEESGVISIVKGGKMTRYADTNMLKNVLSKFYWQELTKTN